MKIFDTHCHYNLEPFYPDWQPVWRQAQAKGVVGSNIVGTDIETSRRAVELLDQNQAWVATVGVHPCQYSQINQADLPTIIAQHNSTLAMMLTNPRVVAIGETGLDLFRTKKADRLAVLDRQLQAFRAHIQLANQYHRPLIIHVRDQQDYQHQPTGAYWQILKTLKKEYQFNQPFVLHCVSGPSQYVHQAIELGAYVGVAANITYPNASQLRQLVSSVPTDRLLLETDAPYLPPQSARGQTCQPWMISQTAAFLQSELAIDPDQLYTNSAFLYQPASQTSKKTNDQPVSRQINHSKK